MHEPSPRTSRLLVAGSVAAIVLLGGGGFLLGRSTVPAPSPAAVSPTPAPAAAPAVPETPAVRLLSRGDMIAIGNAAADATSSGEKMPERVDASEGARFQIDLPFGCEGPAAEDSRDPFQWRYDTASSSLRISVAPAVFDPQEWLGKPVSGDTAVTPPAANEEAIEGFWVARPWSSRETCVSGSAPAASATPFGIDAVTLPGQTLGLAQIFTAEDSRNARRGGKPYESVRRMDAADLKIDRGLRVRLRGRIARFPDGATVRCRQPAGREQRPACLVAATFDDVAIENPATDETMATWASTSRT
ncbi:hypothetical protein ACFSGX_05840 [Sphingomonas arantia]|uniref:Uncharacterized protein n=1 Tax=Sphingomonas arantia TaxID=1460676 RepID=A0ABW4TY04_9SPHN